MCYFRTNDKSNAYLKSIIPFYQHIPFYSSKQTHKSLNYHTNVASFHNTNELSNLYEF